MQIFRKIQRSPVVALIVLLILSAFFAISWHVLAHEHHLHTNNLCQICALFHHAAWIATGITFLLYLTASRHHLLDTLRIIILCASSTRTRAPPLS